MKRKIAAWSSAVFAVCLLMGAGIAYSGEHPEHPVTKKAPAISKEKLAEAIQAYIEKEAARQGGYYQVFDKAAGKPLRLTLVRVHKARLASLGNDVYFACADLKTPAGKLYDLDFFMKGTDAENLKFTRVTIHKEAGKPRYTWYEEDGVWKMMPVVKAKITSEHPHGHEHPK